MNQLNLGLTLGNQRWRARRDFYRRPDEQIRTRAYDVVELEDDTRPRDFVLEHHYSRSFPSARFRFGLYRGDQLEGVAVFSHPCGDNVLTNVFGGVATDSVELGRFVLLDGVALLPSSAWTHVEQLFCDVLAMNGGPPGTITREQLWWLANAPYDDLGPHVHAIYQAIIDLGFEQAIPIDNRRRAEREKGLEPPKKHRGVKAAKRRAS